MRKYFTKRLMAALALCASALLYQQAVAQVAVSGSVVSEDNEPLPGVSVMLKGTSQGTTTDAGGRFTLDLRRTPVDEVEKRVRLVGTYVGSDLVDVDGVSLI